MTITHAHAQPPPPPDYSSSSSSASNPTSPPPTHSSNTTLNLSVLRRYLPSITSIQTIAAYSVIYIFRPTLSTWEKSGIEGTLFVVRLHNQPPAPESYAIIVLNRRGLDNFVLYLRKSEEVEVSDEYVIVQDEEDGEVRIWGLWIFEEEGGSTRGSRERVGGVIVDCARRVERSAVQEGDGDTGRQVGRGGEYDVREVQGSKGHAGLEKMSGPDLMALLNGSTGQGGSGVSAERHAIPDQRQALLNLFRKAS